ncbi:hypothetical protein BD560DRAFT_417279 [Blakeslea trispora]|nr:hypothetical protein BD560DRAFT_417279 [Blakeslea trispora]
MTDTYIENINILTSQLQAQLLTISQAQDELVNTISKTEASLVTTSKEWQEIKSNMDKVAIYHTKLLSLKATMSMLSGRSKQLQERANKLKLMKLNYLSQVDHIRKLEQQKDLTIAAKTSASAPVSPDMSSPTLHALPAEQTAPVISTTKKSAPRVVSKSKKKSKARQVLLDDEEDTDKSSWIPKKSLSQKDLRVEK